jgi:3-oxoadipate enol-lactonase
VRLAFTLEGAGDAPVLVLSGGLGTTTAMWDAQAVSFARQCRILRVDHPGHGRSPVPEGRIAVDGIARAVLTLLDELGIERASFCGLSLGGMVGQWLGANAPERIERLVLACTGASLGTRAVYDERAALVRRGGVEVVTEGARERWFTPAFRDSAEANRIIDELRGIPPDGYAACAEAVGTFDFRADLGRIVPPTLVVVGEEDSVTPAPVVDELATIPGSRRAGIPQAAHLANVEQPKAFSAAVLAHLSSTGDGS